MRRCRYLAERSHFTSMNDESMNPHRVETLLVRLQPLGRTDPTLAPLLFLDFDGVLHPNGASCQSLFSRTSALTEVLDEHPELDVVISSSWRFHHAWEDLLALLPEALADRVSACTGAADPGKYQRYREVTSFARRHSGNGARFRPWRAIDDAQWEFPPGCSELIACDGALGVQVEQMEALRLWLDQLRSCRTAVSTLHPINRPDLVEVANRLLADASTPSVALLQRAFRIGQTEAIALLSNYLRSP